MAEIHNLIDRVEDLELRNHLRAAAAKLNSEKIFGLKFEEHLPEYTPLYELPVRKGRLASLRGTETRDPYIVLNITDGVASCLTRSADVVNIPTADLVTVARFGEPIYPWLNLVDTICAAPDSSLWHTLIEADNYHALQLLEYLYPGQVDCIYIDPPYNGQQKDWKYNNNYVDGADGYKHSKWLSMMKKRLQIAARLLNPKSSVLIVTIDEKEYLYLGCLLEDIFSKARIQMVSSVINPKGSARDGFSRSDEYIFFVMLGDCVPEQLPLSNEWSSSAVISAQEQTGDVEPKTTEPGWTSMMRRGTDSLRKDSPNLYYPIYVDPVSKSIREIGASIPEGQDRAEDIQGLTQVLPLRRNGSQGRWQVSGAELKNRLQQGRVRVGRPTPYGYVINYLPDGEYSKVLNGEYQITGYAGDGSMIAHKTEAGSDKLRMPPTQWKIASHNASENGTALLTSILGEKRFSFPKSLYAVRDCLRFFTASRPDSLIVDFFAGSGTTLHAVNLLNAEDGGRRRCILVTNNEVSADEAKTLSAQGFQPGDREWEQLGIARHVTWPRTVCSIRGQDINGQPLKGNYLGSDRPMSEGFQSNAVFFKLGFLERTSVALGRHFFQMLPILWMKAGAEGPCPRLESGELPSMLILPENGFAVLIVESVFEKFAETVNAMPEIQTVYLLTDYDAGYRAMAKSLKAPRIFQLYRDYLDTFRINAGRDTR